MSWFNGFIQIPGDAPENSTLYHGQEIDQTREQNTSTEPTLEHDNEIVNPNAKNSSCTKRRKLTSKVWNDFTKYEGKDGKIWAICKYCKKKFDGSSKNGTTHLNNHSERCRSSKSKDEEGDKQAGHEKGNLTNPIVLQEKFVINQELNQLDVVRTIIKYSFLELNLIKPDIFRVYQEEKEKVSECLMKLSCRFSLAIKWYSAEEFYMVLHFIDDNWELKRKTISLHNEEDMYFFETHKKSLSDWNVDKHICSVVEDTDIEEFKEYTSNWLIKQGLLPFGGFLFSASCIEKFLTSYNCQGTRRISYKINEFLPYVRKTSNKQKFEIAVERVKSKGGKVASLSFPVSTNDLEELEMVVGFKDAFCELEQIDSYFRPLNFNEEEWEDAETMYAFLKVLNDASHSLSTTKCPSANAFFPIMCDIYSNLLVWERNDNHHVREIASSARATFYSKYWCNSELVLAIAVFLDPRFKMDIIERWYRKIYGVGADGHLRVIVDGVNNVYGDYLNASSKMLDELGRPITFSQTPDLDLYLKEPKIPAVQEFDILNWWHLNSSRYPILAKMARDYLAAPVSHASFSDSSLDTDIEEIMQFEGLDYDLKSPLICARSWLRSSENSYL